MRMSARDADRIRDGENKIVFACERSAHREAHAQQLACPAIHFEQFARAAIDLLANGGAKPHFVGLAFTVRAEADCFRSKRKKCGGVRFFYWPAQKAAR